MSGGGGLPHSGPFRELAPLLGSLAVVESVRTEPVEPVAFAHAKIIHVMSGTTRVTTATGQQVLTAGDVFVLGAKELCQANPEPRVRCWTIYLDQEFLRWHMIWVLPGPERVLPGLHPAQWNGEAMVFHAGTDRLARLEPLLRRMSVVPHRAGPEAIGRLMTLFAQTAEHIIPALLTDAEPPVRTVNGVVGTLAKPGAVPAVADAARRMRADLAHPWSLDALVQAVAMSRSQLSRLFASRYGLSPMRWLTEIRLTEFARLIEETVLPVDAAARRVGWQDRRIASAWFRRRYGVTPTQFRNLPTPVCVGESPCALCRNGECSQAASFG